MVINMATSLMCKIPDAGKNDCGFDQGNDYKITIQKDIFHDIPPKLIVMTKDYLYGQNYKTLVHLCQVLKI